MTAAFSSNSSQHCTDNRASFLYSDSGLPEMLQPHHSSYQTFSGSHSELRKSVLDGSRKEPSHSRDEGGTFNSSRHLDDLFLNEMNEKESGGFLECNPYMGTSLFSRENVLLMKESQYCTCNLLTSVEMQVNVSSFGPNMDRSLIQ